MMEDKQIICDKLLATLQATRGGSDLESIQYEVSKDGIVEIVTLTHTGGWQKRINVSADSGVAMIRDVMKWID